MKYLSDCRFFRGDLPCKPHKLTGVHCESCQIYEKISNRVLIIKLGAMGDVIRTTPLITRLKVWDKGCYITWLTLTPDILPNAHIDEILPFDLKSILYLQGVEWDWVINLDKDKEAGVLLHQLHSKKKSGFIYKNNAMHPVDNLAAHKFYTGLFDDVSKANTKSYPQEIFEICGFEYQQEPYLLDDHRDKGYTWDFPKDKKIIGLNTGCGDRWTTRLWSEEKWIRLIQLIQEKNWVPLLLGGKQEHERNASIQKATGALYPGHFPLPQFINQISQCDIVVTQVTMAMHLTLGLGKKIVLMNNIFNPYEFNVTPERGVIIEPDKICQCFYRGTCVDGLSCMENLPAEKVFEALTSQLSV